MGRRTLLLITSVLVAAIGVALVGLYVRGADARAVGAQQQIRVWVAKQQTSLGERFNPDAFERTDVVRSVVPATYVTDVSSLAGQVATSNIYQGEVLLNPMFGPSSQTSDTVGVAKNRVALALQMSDPGRVAGFLVPGSNVIVYVTYPDEKNGQTTAMLFESARVVAVGSDSAARQASGRPAVQPSGSTASSTQRSLVTLDLDATQAAKAVLAQDAGTLYFGLVNGSGPPDKTPQKPFTLSDLGTTK